MMISSRCIPTFGLAIILMPVHGALLADAADPCLTPDQEIAIESTTPPAYPVIASMLCVEGEVELAFDIRPDGRVDNLRVTDSHPEGLFDETVMTTAHWRFRPACRDGEPITREAVQRIEFVTDPADQPHCPEQLDEDAAEVLAELVTHYARFWQMSASTASGPLDSIAEAPLAQDDLGRIERTHRRIINSEIEAHNALIEYLREHDFQRMTALYNPGPDLDLDEHDARLERLRQLTQEQFAQYLDMIDRHDRWLAEADAETDLDPDVRRVLVERFRADFERQRDALHIEQELILEMIDHHQTLVRILDETGGRWQPHPDGPRFEREADRQRFEEQLAVIETMTEGYDELYVQPTLRRWQNL